MYSGIFGAVCSFSFKTNSTSTKWEYIDIDSKLNITYGAGIAYSNYLYYIFGGAFDANNFIPSNILRLDLSNPTNGWEEYSIPGCDLNLSISNFGYYLDGANLYAVGGDMQGEYTNSILNISLSSNKCTIVYPNQFYPSARNGASLVYSEGSIFLFGGKDRGTYFNDMWSYSLTTLAWNIVSAKGSVPSPRSGHSASGQGKYMMIIGGESYNSIYYGDMFLFDFSNLTWIEILPLGLNAIPFSISDSCAMLDLPYFYFVGGRKPTDLTYSLWRFDFSSFDYKRLYLKNDSDVPIFQHGCSLQKNGNTTEIYTIWGFKNFNDVPYCSIRKFDVSDPKPITIVENTTKIRCRAAAAYKMIGDTILIAGGQNFGIGTFNDVWKINLEPYSETYIGTMPIGTFYSASIFLNNTFSIFSGYSMFGLSDDGPSSDTFQQIEIDNIPEISDFCGPGMVKVSGICQLCPIGYYAEETNLQCIPCPAGTYNPITGASHISQCTPCSLGYYSPNNGSETCVKCDDNNYCFIGSSMQGPPKNYLSNYKHSEQPEIYTPPSIDLAIYILYLVALFFIAVFIFFFFKSFRFRIFMKTFDIFEGSHYPDLVYDFKNDQGKKKSIEEFINDPKNPDDFRNINIDEYINRCNLITRESADENFSQKFMEWKNNKIEEKKRGYGGLCTGITAIVIIFMIIYSLIIYSVVNIQETKSLVPIASLLKQEDFDDQDLTLVLTFNSFRGSCSLDNLELIYSNKNLKIIESSSSNQNGECSFHLLIKAKKIIENEDYIQFSFLDYESYCSEAVVTLKADSSIPGEKSAYRQTIYANDQYVFRGSDPIVFSYDLLPSLYVNTNYVSLSYSNKGYHVYFSTNPQQGSQFPISYLSLSQGLNIKIVFYVNVAGITTFRTPQTTIIPFFNNILGGSTGFFGAVGLFVALTEFIFVTKNTVRSKKLDECIAQINEYLRNNNPEALLNRQNEESSAEVAVN